MADLINFTLPAIDSGTDENTMKQIKNYLFQLTEQMKFYFNNIDSDNFTDAYNQKLSSMTTAQTTNAKQLSVTQQTLKKFKLQLSNAMQEAVNLISGNKGGYVVLHDSDNDTFPDEILIMNTSDISTATKMWRWNMAGLAYSSSGYDSDTFSTNVAVTMNGEINANYIRAGTLKGIRIEAVIGEIGGFLLSPTGMYCEKTLNDVSYKAAMSVALDDLAAPFISVTVGGEKTFWVDYYGWLYLGDERVKNSICVGWDSLEKNEYTAELSGSVFSLMNSNREKFWVCSNYSWSQTIIDGTVFFDYMPVTVSSKDTNGGLTLALHDEHGPSENYMKPYYSLNGGQRFLDDGCRHEFTGSVKFNDEIVSDLVFGTNNGQYYKIGADKYRYLGFTNLDGSSGTQCFSVGLDTRTLKLWSSYLILTSKQLTNSSTTALYINANGYLTISSSSRRYKENITSEICDELNPEKLYALPVRQFNYKKSYKDMEITEGLQIGLIAEEVAEIYPKAAMYSKNGDVESWQDRILIPALLMLVQNLKKEIDNLKTTLNKGE